MSDNAVAVERAPSRSGRPSALGFATRCVEFAVLFAGIPTLIALDVLTVPLIPFLLLVSLGCLLLLLRDRGFDRRQLGNWPAAAEHAKSMVTTFAVGALGIGAFVAFYEPERLFELVQRRPVLWLAIMILYPLLSVYPQELLYRTFFFHRYRSLFPNRYAMIGASALAFGYMHIVFLNVIAVLMTLAGGVLFARRYDETRSTLAASIEHALYGCFIFTIGLGWYFYSGSAR